MKKALLVLVATGMLFSSGCLNWQWWVGASQFASNITNILEDFAVLPG